MDVSFLNNNYLLRNLIEMLFLKYVKVDSIQYWFENSPWCYISNKRIFYVKIKIDHNKGCNKKI